ncbi:MAG: 16S rRNA (cytosine(1402)-N(4))-methyltransferase RsmH [Candidatus Wolfebacteria bacterium]|nr:16S rRNA (cytosine(1402)-N(4))-methyltransferase RsmH [Candidatus Wolfebacteria bacterium]
MHIPVLLKETIELLDPKPGEFFIDGTFGAGGHSTKILEKIQPGGKLLGVDLDEDNLKKAELKILTNFKSQIPNIKDVLTLVHGNYADLPEIMKAKKLPKADALLLDLGFSSEQMDSPVGGPGRAPNQSRELGTGRGFSFLRNEKLDMRYDVSEGETAAEIINSYPEKDLADIFWKYGEERFSRIAARRIVEARRLKKILTSKDLADVVEQAIPRRRGKIWSKIHPATRIFQALRIYVNRELENLEKVLNSLDQIVKGRTKGPARNASYSDAGGRVAIISFHSLEDRMVKIRFRELQKEQKAEILTKKPVIPTDEEVLNNPRSRSAKMRAIKLI